MQASIEPLPHRSQAVQANLPIGSLTELALGILAENLLIGFRTEQAYKSFLLSRDGFQGIEMFTNLPQKLDLTRYLPKCSKEELILKFYSWPNEDEKSVGIEVVLSFVRLQICGHWESSILQGACVTLLPEIFSHDLEKDYKDLGYFNRNQLA